MANFVIKKDGTKEPLDAGKIKNSIAGAAQSTELSEERKSEITEQVSNAVLQGLTEKEEITSTEIRENILSQLSAVEPSVAESWKKHEQEKI